jgi:hypothetical protein
MAQHKRPGRAAKAARKKKLAAARSETVARAESRAGLSAGVVVRDATPEELEAAGLPAAEAGLPAAGDGGE